MAKRKTAKSPSKPKGVRDLPCLCGCGGPTITPKAKFLPGHDAKLKSILLQIERGEIDADSVPEIARPFLGTCSCCGQPIMKHDSGKGPICRSGKCKCKGKGKSTAKTTGDKKKIKPTKPKKAKKIEPVESVEPDFIVEDVEEPEE